MANGFDAYGFGQKVRQAPDWIQRELQTRGGQAAELAQAPIRGAFNVGRGLADFGMDFYGGLTGSPGLSSNAGMTPPPSLAKPSVSGSSGPMVPPPAPPSDFTSARPSWMNMPGIPAETPTPSPALPNLRTPQTEASEAVNATTPMTRPQSPASSPALSYSWGKDVELGANGRPVRPSWIQDQITGRKIQDRSDVGGGGVLSYPGGAGSDAQIDRVRNAAGDDIGAQADISRNLALAQDPAYLIKEQANAGANAYASRAQAQQDAEARSRQALLARKAQIDSSYNATIADNEKRGYTPEELAKANILAEQRRTKEYNESGIPEEGLKFSPVA
jgi:hypothetical protein